MTRKIPTLGDLSSLLSSGLERVALRPDANSYVPHPKQVKFHASQAKGRLYIGGNRSGKTVGGVIEDIQTLTHKNPHWKPSDGPIRGRLVCVDFPNGWEKIVKPVLSQWIPPSALINGSWDDSFNNRTRTLSLANGSFLEIMSYDQEVQAFAGSSLHFVHFDEEPPKDIWTECRMRLMDTAGRWWITMTPVEGLEWIEDELFEPYKEFGVDNEFNCDVIQVDTDENIYLSQVEIDAVFSGMEDDDLKVRKQGRFVKKGGLIYKEFNPNPKEEGGHVIPSLNKARVPRNWRIIASMDHGFNNATSWHWHAVSPNNTVITFAEHYKPQWTVPQHAARVKEIEEEWFISPEFRVGDPAIKQRNQANGNSIQLEYRLNGIHIIPGNNDVNTGIIRTAEYIRQGKWYITEDNPNLIWELKRYRWATRASQKLQERNGPIDKPHKKHDHGCDDSRYFFMSLPELAPREVPIDLAEQKRKIQDFLRGAIGHRIDVRNFDPNTSRKILTNPNQISTDETLGGIW